eukprot:1158683-Ditylum_brightwellii.AAC.1
MRRSAHVCLLVSRNFLLSSLINGFKSNLSAYVKKKARASISSARNKASNSSLISMPSNVVVATKGSSRTRMLSKSAVKAMEVSKVNIKPKGKDRRSLATCAK